MNRIAVRFLIPIREDPVIGTGRKHPAFRWKSLERALRESFGGWTKWDSLVRGVWIDPGTGCPVADESWTYEVDVDEARLEEIRYFLRRACRTFAQQCIRTVILGRVEYVEGGPCDHPL